MFAVLGSLFGSAKAGAAIVDGVKSAADKLFYTSEEKADDAAKARSEGFSVYMRWLESTSGSRLARRFLALGVFSIWALEHVTSVAMQITATFATAPEKYKEAAALLADHAADNNALVGVVLMFYFGGPVAMDGIKGLVGKWVDKTSKAAT